MEAGNALTSQNTLTTPFENIALCFSGGGFRAASFALGALSYFNELKLGENENPAEDTLLKKVTYLSSASGGTIATAFYSLYSVNGRTFDEFYKDLYSALHEDDLLVETLEILNDSSVWEKRPSKRRNMINAFALAYDKRLFDTKTIGDLQGKETHLEEVCFNTTEFYRGLLFRQNVGFKSQPDYLKKTMLFGNHVMNLDHDAAAFLKLGDVLAASSCFPGGLEPIIFPNDLIHDNVHNENYYIKHLNVCLQTGGLEELEFLFGKQPVEKLKEYRDILMNGGDRNKLVYQPNPQFGLMDGGITDNLGLDSMMKANNRRKKEFDLMMTNDVGTIFMDPYAVPEKSNSIIGNITITHCIFLVVIFFVIGLTLLVKSAPPASIVHPFVFAICGTLLVSLGGLGIVLLTIAYRFLQKAGDKDSGLNLDKTYGKGMISSLLGWFRKTPLNVLAQMIKARLSSMLILNTDIFLKRVRQILYESFFEFNKGSHRVQGSRVYDLAFSNDINRKLRNLDYKPSSDMQKVAETAYSMGTTLWFDKKEVDKFHRQACLVACGQFTTCYNLLNYIDNLKGPNPGGTFDPPFQERVDTLKAKLKADYIKFQTESPFFLYNEMGDRCKPLGYEKMDASMIPFPENFKGLIPE